MTSPPPLTHDAALFIDVDGTLLDLAPRPDLVEVPAGLPCLLARLAAQRDGALALVSGRQLADLDRLFPSWRGPVAGLHGAQRRRADGSFDENTDHAGAGAAEALDRLRPKIADAAARLPGVWLEDKGGTLALHYRAAPEREAEVRAFAERMVGEAGGSLRSIAGKMVVELQPSQHGKGRAIAAFLREAPFAGRRPVFLGDDTTDEDGFTEVNRRGGVSIRVGEPNPATAAEYALPSVAATRAWLDEAARAAAEPRRAAVGSMTGATEGRGGR